ncbi:MAG: hypothetical protein MUC36_16825 [Planctomycetes bacterium]|nr:hypothetical protein [Planctomycetota bacterium]
MTGPDPNQAPARASPGADHTATAIDPPHTLLGRLQRGRGDAVRELLVMPIETARAILLHCLFTAGDLTHNHQAHAELVQKLAPDLTHWLRWVAALPIATPAESAADECTRLGAFHLLGDLAGQGHADALAFLREHVFTGRHWQDALTQLHWHELDFEPPPDAPAAAAWSQWLARLDDEALTTLLATGPAHPMWRRLGWHERVRPRLDQAPACSSQPPASNTDAPDQPAEPRRVAPPLPWSEAAYAAAPNGAQRWRVLESLRSLDPAAAIPLLIDGLWDGHGSYRERCIAHCLLDRPGVRERLLELANGFATNVAAAARRRLQLDAADPA